MPNICSALLNWELYGEKLKLTKLNSCNKVLAFFALWITVLSNIRIILYLNWDLSCIKDSSSYKSSINVHKSSSVDYFLY